MSRWYDRDGQPIADLTTWGALFERADYKRVAETMLPDGKWVSTVWLGLDHQWGDGSPLIFETMVFSGRGDMADLDCERYSTLAEAEAGHAAMVAKWGPRPPRSPRMTEFETQVAQALYAARQQWRPVDMQARPDLMDWLAPRVAKAIEAALHWSDRLPVTAAVQAMSGKERTALLHQQGREAAVWVLRGDETP